MAPQLEALIHAAVERQITVGELTTVTRSLPQEDRDLVYSTIRRKQRESTPRLRIMQRHRSVMGGTDADTARFG